jgi:mono/diheme cytochrome c family protein
MKSFYCFGRTLLVGVLVLFLDRAAESADRHTLDPKVQGYFKTHCLRCHSQGAKESEFHIDALSAKVGFDDTPQWLEVIERINSGEMPPAEVKPRPTADESAAVVEWLAARIKEGEAARMAARDRVSYNRLTRDEYVNTVRDLLGVQFDATDPGGFLDDPEWRGFERIGSVLTLSPSNIEKYLTAAETILAEAYPAVRFEFLEASKRAILETQIAPHHHARLSALGLLDKVRYDLWPGDVFRYSVAVPLPEAGIYEFSYTLSGLKPEKGRAPRLYVYESKLDRVLHEQDVIAPEDAPTTVTFRTHLPKGRPNITVINEVPGPSNLPRSGRHGSRPFVSIKDGRIPWQMKLTDEQGRARYPFLIIDSVAVRGPIITPEERQRRYDYMPPQHADGSLEPVREALGRMARRAFRRPVTDEELNGFVGIVEAELSAGEKYRDAVKAGMSAILCSKSFLFLAEGDENSDRNNLNDWEIASRLSYLLWSTMPDDELFTLAEQGKLRDKTERSRQVARMLADPRSQRFCEAFTTQWLNLQKVGMFPPDKQLYPEYDSNLEKSMIAETKAFFREVLHSGLTLREFLDSDWTMLNVRLADYYGVPSTDLPRDEFVRVSLPAQSRRGGVLTQAAILSLTSDGTRHRPVHRGKWLSESILGKSPPPPPANVDPIEPNPVDSPKATLRMKLEAHIHDARCASCHAKIDPYGLAFENYDAIGRWRTEEKTEGTGANPQVDPSGKFPDGRKFADADEFKRLMLADLDTFAAAFIEKLATYGLRRTMSFDDREELAAILTEVRADDYRLRDLVEALVTSDLFENR